MKIRVDEDACQEHGQCVLIAPDVFDLGVDGLTYVPDPPDELEATVQEAAAACPVQAILLGPAT
ncbi:ferredoxin [Nocardioides humi]|uniref:Ferredoxin n=1 Tax=Nocardioides humi TaxID=449461 RepID=A0ABN2AF73_9ACTN|nr:ferredoxin [Nocardioides humi]